MFLEDLKNGCPLNIDYDRDGDKGNSATSGFFARKGAVAYFPTTLKSTTPPKPLMTEKERRLNALFGSGGQASVTTPMEQAASSAPAKAEPRIDVDLL